ncbi:hypothetical protein [Streptomyces sp. NPDC004533]|uniref:hypothetical protein n=1 Tax=Streptomyces sp. NPDC004533 TaxID=3154278 RepID=UPI00339E0D1A
MRQVVPGPWPTSLVPGLRGSPGDFPQASLRGRQGLRAWPKRHLYLEGLLVGARNRGLPPELIERLEDAIDHGHELTVLLADTVRTTTAAAHATSGT